MALRGIGGTSPSRSLVLADGMPLNDAFGGWVFWDKVPQAAIDRIEVDRGSGSDLYGADALGGVIQLVTVGRTVQSAACWSKVAVSAPAACRCSAAAVLAIGDTAARANGSRPTATFPSRKSRTPESHREGPWIRTSDRRTDRRRRSRDIRPSTGWRFDISGNVFSEDRNNGTPLSINSTDSKHATAGYDTGELAGGVFTVRGYGGTQRYHQTFTTVNALRTAEVFIRDQHVPTRHSAAVAASGCARGETHTVLVGAEGRYVKGRIDRDAVRAGTAARDDGGRRRRPPLVRIRPGHLAGRTSG